MLFSHFEILVH